MSSETTPLQPHPAAVAGQEDVDSSRRLNSLGDKLYEFYESNSFVLKVAAAILVAKIWPPLGAVYFYPDVTASWLAVIFIFLMAGLSLKAQELSKAVSRIWFNVFVQVFNFGVVSLVVFGASKVVLFLGLVPEGLANGMVICGCIPITVTMVIVLTKSAAGDDASAVFHAAAGSLLGVFVSPTLILTYIGMKADVDFNKVLLKLVVRIIVPIGIGQLLQKSATVVAFVRRNKARFKGFQEWTLVFIVYCVFCKMFQTDIQVTIVAVLWMFVCQVLVLCLCMVFAWYSLKFLFRDEPRLRVMGLFGCTQKSAAMGIPLINAIYENDPLAGLYTLPLLIWHPTQLVLGSASSAACGRCGPRGTVPKQREQGSAARHLFPTSSWLRARVDGCLRNSR